MTKSAAGGALLALALLFAAPARADVALRLSVDQHGDFVVFGNTLAQNCGGGVPDPLVGDVGACGDDIGDSGADVFWSVDGDGDAVASTAVAFEDVTSLAVLTLPPGAAVTHARLYWSALSGGGNTSVATLGRAGAFSEDLSADSTAVVVNGGDEFYQGSADVTELVRERGAGTYQVSGVDAADIVDVDSSVYYAGWWMVVFYELSTEPLRNLTLFDGFELVSEDNNQTATLSGFRVPAGGFDAKLAVAAYEGDASIDGDELRFGPSAPLGAGAALLDSDNFFDSSRLGEAGSGVSFAGDLPRLSGASNSMSGIDLDVVDVTDRITPGQTSAAIAAITDFDLYLLSGFVTSITTFSPDLTTSVKTVSDVNGPPLRPGDELEYTVTLTNTGNDAALEVLLLDPLPASVTYVPGSLAISSGPNLGPLTDGADADQGELSSVSGAQTLVVRVGGGADGSLGGRLDIAESSVVSYRVSVDAGISGTIENQAEISALGELGGTSSVTPTDGNAVEPGAPPTEISIDACAVDVDCTGATRFCDVAQDPRRCVECLLDADCPGLRPTCNGARACVCVGSGSETSCDGRDDNCDARIDEGFVGIACSVGVGSCAAAGLTACDTVTTTRCAAVPGAPGLELCLGGDDEDCDGLVDLADSDCVDGDGDGVSDGIELAIGTNPGDADSDDDGVADGAEPSFDQDSDVDGLINALDPDSDNDALRDGTESGSSCAGPGTLGARCIPDADAGFTVTDPLVADTDGGGAIDGSEDANLNGVQDDGESDPGSGRGADDGQLGDADNDVLSDALEEFLGSDPADADSDDDGLSDGLEPNPGIDSDDDGLSGVVDPDSDNDGLFDGTETGHACDDPATRSPTNAPRALVTCVADADPSTRTSALVSDTDGGGVSDGREDANQDGAVDAGETDPSDPEDDAGSTSCLTDAADCGYPASGRICAGGSCMLGCRLDVIETCPPGHTCELFAFGVGRCRAEAESGLVDAGGAGGEPGGPAAADGGGVVPGPILPEPEIGASLGGGGCSCRVTRGVSADARVAALIVVAAFALRRRRAPRAHALRARA